MEKYDTEMQSFSFRSLPVRCANKGVSPSNGSVKLRTHTKIDYLTNNKTYITLNSNADK